MSTSLRFGVISNQRAGLHLWQPISTEAKKERGLFLVILTEQA